MKIKMAKTFLGFFLGIVLLSGCVPNPPSLQPSPTVEAKLTVQSSPTVDSPTSTPQKKALEEIQFNYTDSPLDHGWNFIEGTAQPTFESVNNTVVGRAIKATTTTDNFYAIDYELSPSSIEFGNYLEVVAYYPDDKSSLYTYIEMKNNNSETLRGWLKFKVGKERSIPSQKTTGEQEWLIYVYPESYLDLNWAKMQINLEKTVKETFGKDGWSFQRLIKLRIRGNLGIDSITIFHFGAN